MGCISWQGRGFYPNPAYTNTMPKKTLLVVLSGVGDGLVEGRETSLQRAAKPTLDLIAKNGYSGLVENSSTNPSSELSLFNLLGYASDYPGDGLLEALSV